jgi:hypothetical protein
LERGLQGKLLFRPSLSLISGMAAGTRSAIDYESGGGVDKYLVCRVCHFNILQNLLWDLFCFLLRLVFRHTLRIECSTWTIFLCELRDVTPLNPESRCDESYLTRLHYFHLPEEPGAGFAERST